MVYSVNTTHLHAHPTSIPLDSVRLWEKFAKFAGPWRLWHLATSLGRRGEHHGATGSIITRYEWPGPSGDGWKMLKTLRHILKRGGHDHHDLGLPRFHLWGLRFRIENFGKQLIIFLPAKFGFRKVTNLVYANWGDIQFNQQHPTVMLLYPISSGVSSTTKAVSFREGRHHQRSGHVEPCLRRPESNLCDSALTEFYSEKHWNLFRKTLQWFLDLQYCRYDMTLAQWIGTIYSTHVTYILHSYWDSSKAFKFGRAASPIGPGSKLRPKSWKESEGRTAPPIAFFLGVPSHFVFQDPNVFEGGWRVFGEVKW